MKTRNENMWKILELLKRRQQKMNTKIRILISGKVIKYLSCGGTKNCDVCEAREECSDLMDFKRHFWTLKKDRIVEELFLDYNAWAVLSFEIVKE